MKKWFTNPQTTIGAIIALFALAGLWSGKISDTTSITILGIAAVWIGVTAKDQNKQ